MTIPTESTLLRIFIGETDRHHGRDVDSIQPCPGRSARSRLCIQQPDTGDRNADSGDPQRCADERQRCFWHEDGGGAGEKRRDTRQNRVAIRQQDA